MTAEGAVGVRAHVVVGSRDVDVAIEVRAGECLAVIGPNGAGKSTVLEALAGLLPIDAGRIELDGVQVSSPRHTVPAHRRRTGLVAQRSDLFPFLDVVGNVAFGPRAAGAGRAAARQLARDALDAVGGADLATRDPRTLSGGQAQRVAIARALATDPAVLLLDEPTSALDVGAQDEVRAALRTAVAGRPAVLVTHDPVEVVALADRVVVLEGGRVVEQGTPAAVLGRPTSAFAATFSGLALVRGTATGGGIAIDGGGELASGAHAVPPGRPALAAFHPTAAVLTRGGAGAARTVSSLEPRDGLVRVRAGDLVADLTLARLTALGIAPGDAVRIDVPAAEVAVYAPRG
ncbi:ABC transporter ATP-binding protein [Curtobacterium flaccumfaciens pv. flaccumfaciens]|uniref:ABC transporter ATP-binding protein n=1 Tax=Curtobacterium flaccumfaciens TaxID=2035 RepID=UPI00217E14CC|nr:ABC transporter ATP-binding protein [Curtobacterium flaccumfaciens]MCS6549210.1 ABC transporter ATP-binding protein [Curtobacterium flaccumfaciens pv. flaccumfaciens]